MNYTRSSFVEEETLYYVIAERCLAAKMAATMLRSLTKLGRPSTKLLLNNNALSPCSTVLQNRWVNLKSEVNTLIAIWPVSA